MPAHLPRLIATVLAVAGFLSQAPCASAEFLTLNFQGGTTNPGNPTVAFTLNGTSYTDFAVGPFYWNQNSVPQNLNFPPAVATFCIEIDKNQPLPPIGTNTTFSVVNPLAAPTIGNDTAKIAAIQELYGRYFDTTWTDKTTFHGDTNSVAFQVALWELIYDGSSNKNLNSGNFQAPDLGTYTTTAQNMLDSLNGDASQFASKFGNSELVALLAPADGGKTQDNVQDQLILRSPPQQAPAVPAPPAVMLAGLGVLALAGRARWIRRKPA